MKLCLNLSEVVNDDLLKDQLEMEERHRRIDSDGRLHCILLYEIVYTASFNSAPYNIFYEITTSGYWKKTG